MLWSCRNLTIINVFCRFLGVGQGVGGVVRWWGSGCHPVSWREGAYPQDCMEVLIFHNYYWQHSSAYYIFCNFAAVFWEGEVLEWLKRHAWKACNRQNRFAGSNPVLSASFISVQLSPCRRRAVFFCILYSCCPTPPEGAVDNAKLIAAVPIGGFVFLFPRFLRKHHDFTFSPHQSPETMLSPLISPLRQAEIHELVIVQRRGDTRR